MSQAQESQAQAGVAAPPYIGLRAVGVTTADIDAAMAFYAAELPFALVHRSTMPAAAFGIDLLHRPIGVVEIATVAVPTGLVQLMHFSAGAARSDPLPVTGPGYTHICWQSPATDPALPKLLDRGLALVSRCGPEGVDLGGYGVRYAYGRDPEQRMIEVEMLDHPHRTDHAWVAHLANVVHDHAAMLAFYTRLLGCEPYRVVLEGGGRKTHDDVIGADGVRFHGGWFRLANMDIEVWQFLHPPTPAPAGRHRLDEIGYNAPLFECADLDAEVARLGRLGIALVGPRLDLAGLATQYAVDPEGNLFAVQQGSPGAPGGSAADYARA